MICNNFFTGFIVTLSSVVLLFFAGFKMCIRIVKVNACSAS